MKREFDNIYNAGYFKRNKIEGKKLEFDNGWSVSEIKLKMDPGTTTGITIRNDEDAANALFNNWDHDLINIQEQIGCLFLNSKHEVIGYRIISTGKTHSSSFNHNMMITCALLCKARSIILAHNHPDENLTPSNQDIKFTRRVMELLELFEISLIDHIILSKEGYFSFANHELVIITDN
jgi:DNA repair protein RadC